MQHRWIGEVECIAPIHAGPLVWLHRCMRFLTPDGRADSADVTSVVECPLPGNVENYEPVGDEANVWTVEPRGAGHQPAALRRGTEKNRVRGYHTRRRLVELHCYEGKRLVECAREMGLSYGRVLAVWHQIVGEVAAEGPKAADIRRDVRAYSDQVLRHLIEKSLPLARNSAAHAMVALKALESLGRLHGVASPDTVDISGSASMEEIGAAVRVISPVLVGKMERIEKAGNSKGN